LSKAFGRNGIQALIIENALPEIENEANAILARMSDNALQLQLKTQKELRAGGQAETLDIEISDGAGARKYELYSGGEAFRVNFALRIALSKLLSRRAGARLETLVIDEGFGSQDLEGRQRLVEAIQAVQDDFAKILVITHLEDLKDAFPTRVEVTKNASGSQVAIY
jgi:DNA repair protein SbcC/Rad50